MLNEGAFEQGAFFLVDGQYGSTGKGLAAAFLAEHMHDRVKKVTSNAGPNSGHTSYFESMKTGNRKIVLQQLPTFSVYARYKGSYIPVYMNAGSVISPNRLMSEIRDHGLSGNVYVHECAAIANAMAQEAEKVLVQDIGSTGKGTGGALAAKVLRRPGSVAADSINRRELESRCEIYHQQKFDMGALVEVSQGYSLSINKSGFYPFTTSRDCTVAQAASDAGIHPYDVGATMMVVRTYPIRVGGNSGPCYADQHELTWEALGQEPETTTVTGKVRRVFTWSDVQFQDATLANRPDYLFINFMNYLPREQHAAFVSRVKDLYFAVMGKEPKAILMGHGPKVGDVETWAR